MQSDDIQSLRNCCTITAKSMHIRIAVQSKRYHTTIASLSLRYRIERKCCDLHRFAIALKLLCDRSTIALKLLCILLQSLRNRFAIAKHSDCYHCAIAAQPLRNRCTFDTQSLRCSAIASPLQRNRCVIEALSLRHRSAIQALFCMMLCNRLAFT
jgi:hypothetical protein